MQRKSARNDLNDIEQQTDLKHVTIWTLLGVISIELKDIGFKKVLVRGHKKMHCLEAQQHEDLDVNFRT